MGEALLALSSIEGIDRRSGAKFETPHAGPPPRGIILAWAVSGPSVDSRSRRRTGRDPAQKGLAAPSKGYFWGYLVSYGQPTPSTMVPAPGAMLAMSGPRAPNNRLRV